MADSFVLKLLYTTTTGGHQSTSTRRYGFQGVLRQNAVFVGLFERAQKAFDLEPDSFDLTYTDDVHANRSARLTHFSDFTALVCDQVDQQMSLGHLQRDIKGRIVVVFNVVPKQDVQTSLPGPELFIDQAEDDMGTTMPGGFSLAPVDPVTVQTVHDEEEEDDNKPLSLLKREQPTLMRQSKRDDASEFPAAEPVTCQAGPPPPPTVSLSQIQSHIHPIRGPVHRHIHQPRASSPCHPDHGQLQDADVIEGTEGAAGTEDPRMIQMKRSLDARRKVQEALQQQSRSKPLSPTAVPSAPSPVSPMADGYHPKYTTSVPDSTALSEPHTSSSMHGNAPQRPPAAETWPGVKGLTRFVDDFNRFLSDNFGDEGAFELRLDKRPSDNDADVKHQPASSPEEAISEESQAEASYVHRNVFCDFCLKTIVGRRWKCAGCSNFDSCNSCYTTKVPAHHSSNHPFILITRSQAKSSLINANSKLPVPAVRSFRPRHSATCDICDKSVFGTRYKCLSCKDWDVCEECINQVTDKHDASHEYAKMELPGSVATLYTPPAHSARDVTLADEVHSAFCDCCAETIVGPRYKCNTCPDFDLCSLCILKSTTAHPETLHNFKRIARPGATPTLFYPPRQISQWSVKAGYLATCDVCSQAIGDDSSRYKCLSCTDWDAGDCCWAQLGEQGQSPHPSSHTFGRIDRPGAAMVMCRPPLGDNGENTAEAKARKGEDDEEKVATDRKTVQASHPARCDSCQQTIIGVRYKCLACPDYDLDETCFAQAEATHPSHNFVAIEDPLSIIYSSAHTESNLAPATHRFIVCDGCGTSPIVGTRYHCAHALCPDLDLCDKCEADPIPLPPSVKHEHDKRTHPMIKIPRPMERFGVGEKDVTNAVLKARRGMSQHEEISRSSSNSSSTEDKATAQSNEFSLEAVVNGALQALGAGAAEANASSSVSLPEWATLSRPVHRQLDAQSGSGDDTTVMIDVDVGRMLAAQMGGLTVDIEREAKIEITSGDDKAKTQGQAQSQKLDESVEVQDAVASGVSLDESPRATFVADVTLQDGSIVPAGGEFNKIWLVCNSGATAWPAGTTLVNVGGFSSSVQVASLRSGFEVAGASPGETVEVSCELKAPEDVGHYMDFWRLRNPSTGELFGDRFWVDIVVERDDGETQLHHSGSSLGSSFVAPVMHASGKLAGGGTVTSVSGRSGAASRDHGQSSRPESSAPPTMSGLSSIGADSVIVLDDDDEDSDDFIDDGGFNVTQDELDLGGDEESESSLGSPSDIDEEDVVVSPEDYDDEDEYDLVDSE